MLIQTWPVLRVFWHDILPHSTATEYGLLLFSRPHVSKTPTILHEQIERRAAHLSYHERESSVKSHVPYGNVVCDIAKMETVYI